MKIIIHGVPIPQARMRHSSFNGFVTTYDPNSKQKKAIKAFLQCQAALHEINHPRISFIFHMPILKSTRKRDLPLYESGFLKHDKKPDIDNLVKLYLDCLDGIMIHGDQKVTLGPCIKVYHPQPKTIIFIEEGDSTVKEQDFDFRPLYVEQFDRSSFLLQDCRPD